MLVRNILFATLITKRLFYRRFLFCVGEEIHGYSISGPICLDVEHSCLVCQTKKLFVELVFKIPLCFWSVLFPVLLKNLELCCWDFGVCFSHVTYDPCSRTTWKQKELQWDIMQFYKTMLLNILYTGNCYVNVSATFVID